MTRAGGIRLRSVATAVRTPLAPATRDRLERRARLLAWGGNAWHVIEFAIAVGAGIAAGSIALVAFGIDSLIEGAASAGVTWLATGGRSGSAAAQPRPQQLIAASFFALAAYVIADTAR